MEEKDEVNGFKTCQKEVIKRWLLHAALARSLLNKQKDWREERRRRRRLKFGADPVDPVVVSSPGSTAEAHKKQSSSSATGRKAQETEKLLSWLSGLRLNK